MSRYFPKTITNLPPWIVDQVPNLGTSGVPNQVCAGSVGIEDTNVHPGIKRVKVQCNQDFFVDNYVETPFVNIMGVAYADQLKVTRVDAALSATDTTDAAFSVLGGIAVQKNVEVGTTLGVGGIASFNSTTASTSTTTGAVTVAGGVGVAGAMNIGGATNIADTTASSSVLTGALTVAGGMGVHGAAYVGALAVSGSAVFNNTVPSSSTTSGSVIISGGVGIYGNMNVGGATYFSNTTASTSTTTGALKVAGGVGVAGAMNVGGATNITNTTVSSSSTTGALKVAGGVGIAGDLYVGGTISANVSQLYEVVAIHDLGTLTDIGLLASDLMSYRLLYVNPSSFANVELPSYASLASAFNGTNGVTYRWDFDIINASNPLHMITFSLHSSTQTYLYNNSSTLSKTHRVVVYLTMGSYVNYVVIN
jgi:hypothetical protein